MWTVNISLFFSSLSASTLGIDSSFKALELTIGGALAGVNFMAGSFFNVPILLSLRKVSKTRVIYTKRWTRVDGKRKQENDYKTRQFLFEGKDHVP